MAIKRDEQGNLVVDGKVVPKYTEQLYLRRGVGGVGDKAEFPAKAEPDKVQDMEQPYDAHITMAGGEVRRNDKVLKDLPPHPECMVPEKLERPEVKVNTGEQADGQKPSTTTGCPQVQGPEEQK